MGLFLGTVAYITITIVYFWFIYLPPIPTQLVVRGDTEQFKHNKTYGSRNNYKYKNRFKLKEIFLKNHEFGAERC